MVHAEKCLGHVEFTLQPQHETSLYSRIAYNWLRTSTTVDFT